MEEKEEKGVVWIDSEHNLGRAPQSEERAFVVLCENGWKCKSEEGLCG